MAAGDLIVATEDELLEFASPTGGVVDRLALSGQLEPCFLPNGNLLVVGGSALLLEIGPAKSVLDG